METFRKNKPEFIQKIAKITIFIILIGAFAWKPLMINLLRNRAGRLLEGYLKAYASEYEDYLTCQLPVITELPPEKGLSDAVTLLEKAKSLRPQNRQTNLMLGRAYCLQGDYYNAIESFEGFSKAHPDNPLGDLESALAHFSLSITSEELKDAQKSALKQKSRLLIEEQGLSGNYFLERGNVLFNNRAFAAAWYWYYLAEVFQAVPEEISFRTAVMDLVFNDDPLITVDVEEQYITTLNEDANISPDSFFHLEDGSPVNTREIQNKKVGIYYRNKDLGVNILKVQESGRYCLSIEAFDRPPKPTQIQLSLDFNPLTLIELKNGDDTWQSFDINTYLEKGIYLLGIRLINDDNVNGVDRNGNLGQIMIKLCQN
jgi:tetratricopeptide (TPR) repeat protein